MGRRANGEGTIYEFTQKVKKNNKGLEVCSICKNCEDWSICNNREDCKTKCDKCKNCQNCFKYCDRYYIYDRHAQQCSTKEGKRTNAQYGKKKKEVAEKNIETLTKIRGNEYVDKSDITLHKIAKEIIENKHDKNITNDNSYTANLAKLNRLDKHNFMHIPVQEVTDKHLHEYLNSMTFYSQSVISKDYGLLNTSIKRAIKYKILTFNPLDDKDEFRMPKSKQGFKKVIAFTVKEQQQFLTALKRTYHKYKRAWLLSLFTGMRPGEVYALNIHEDIDLDEEIIHVNTTLTKDDEGSPIMGDRTKTYSGTRDIKMDANSKLIIKEALDEYIENDKNLLFCSDEKSYVSISSSNSAFKRFCQKNKIAKGFDNTQYMLRHSFATRKIESGTPAEVLKDILGHKDIQVTLNTYFDAFAEYKNKFEEQSYNYNQDNNLNYAEMDKTLIIKRELENITFYIKHSIIEETYKSDLLYNIAVISQKYRQSESVS